MVILGILDCVDYIVFRVALIEKGIIGCVFRITFLRIIILRPFGDREY